MDNYKFEIDSRKFFQCENVDGGNDFCSQIKHCVLHNLRDTGEKS